MNITPCPTNTSSSMATPSQMKVCEEILQSEPIVAFFWISTNAPIFVSSPISHPYRFTRSGWWIITSRPSRTVLAIGMSGRHFPGGFLDGLDAARCVRRGDQPQGNRRHHHEAAPVQPQALEIIGRRARNHVVREPMAEIRGLGDLLERALRHQCRDRGDEEGPDPIRHRPFGIAGREQHDDKGKRVGKVAPLIVAADGGHADDRRDIREPFRLAPQETDTLRGTRRDQDADAAEDGEAEVKEERDERLVTPELEVVPKIGWLQDPESRQPRHEIAKPERGDDGRRVDGERAQRLARQPRLAMDAEDGNHQSELAADRGEHREHPESTGLRATATAYIAVMITA